MLKGNCVCERYINRKRMMNPGIIMRNGGKMRSGRDNGLVPDDTPAKLHLLREWRDGQFRAVTREFEESDQRLEQNLAANPCTDSSLAESMAE